MKKKIIIVGGDPQSINSEIIFKTWKKISLQNRKNIFLVCNFDLLNKQFKALGYKIKLKKVNSLLDNDSDKLKLLMLILNLRIVLKYLKKFIYLCKDLFKYRPQTWIEKRG